MGSREATAIRGKVRQRLLRFVASRKAIHKAQIARHLGVGWSTVQHHARSLVREGKLREVEYAGLRFLLPRTIPRKHVARTVVLTVPENKKALATIIKRRDVRIQDVARRLGWSRKAARRSLYALLEVGLVQKTRDYHPRFLPTPAGRDFLRGTS